MTGAPRRQPIVSTAATLAISAQPAIRCPQNGASQTVTPAVTAAPASTTAGDVSRREKLSASAAKTSKEFNPPAGIAGQAGPNRRGRPASPSKPVSSRTGATWLRRYVAVRRAEMD